MTPEQKLHALFGEAAPPARDPVFEAAVAQRIARRRAFLSVAAAAPWAVVGASVLWGLQPVLSALQTGAEALNPAAMLVAASAVAAGTAMAVVRRLTPPA
jgi:hypothetical protein